MSLRLHIDYPTAGTWVMSRVKGVFTPGMDHSFTAHRGEDIVGGFALCQYLGASLSIHMAGEDKHWCSRELLWMVFHYAFEQLKCRKVFAPVRSDNYEALSQDLRAGFILEAVLREVYDENVHMMVLSMTKEACPWLDYEPTSWRAGGAG